MAGGGIASEFDPIHNEETIKLVKEKDASLVPQAFWIETPASFWVPRKDTIPVALNKKMKPALEGTDTVFKRVKKHQILETLVLTPTVMLAMRLMH